MNWIKLIFRAVGYLSFLVISVAVLLEIIFRILPTTTPVDLQSIDREDDILRFKTNEIGTFSLGANFYKTVKKRTNNFGFYSSYDYQENAHPDIAIIGDSYVEAAQIKNSDTVGELLKADSANKLVYQFGVSGVPISQYIKMVSYAKEKFSPKHYVIILVGNDFDQSLCSYRIKEGTWCFDANYTLTFNPFEGYQGIRKFVRRSALIRYLVFQVGLDWRPLIAKINLKDPGLSAESRYAGNVERYKSEDITKASMMAIDRFMQELIQMNINDKVTVVLDADRRDIYSGVKTESYFNSMRAYTMQSAKLNNIKVIDMYPIFKNDFVRNSQKFEFPTDGHWNERAHKLLAEALLSSSY